VACVRDDASRVKRDVTCVNLNMSRVTSKLQYHAAQEVNLAGERRDLKRNITGLRL